MIVINNSFLNLNHWMPGRNQIPNIKMPELPITVNTLDINKIIFIIVSTVMLGFVCWLIITDMFNKKTSSYEPAVYTLIDNAWILYNTGKIPLYNDIELLIVSAIQLIDRTLSKRILCACKSQMRILIEKNADNPIYNMFLYQKTDTYIKLTFLHNYRESIMMQSWRKTKKDIEYLHYFKNFTMIETYFHYKPIDNFFCESL